MSASAFIQIRGLNLVYESKSRSVHALADVDLSIAEGDFVCLIGPSGCGKSTLLKAIGAILQPTSGSITVDGVSTEQARRARRIGNVFQESLLLPWRTVEANIRYLCELAGKRVPAGDVRDLADFVGIGGFLGSYPHELSGGMRQRAALCRALLLDPAVLLMDEPFAALDAITREKMQVELLRIWQETRKTIVFVTHAIDEAAFLSDRIVVMSARPGRIQREVANPLPRPRDAKVRYSHQASDLEAELHGELARAESSSEELS